LPPDSSDSKKGAFSKLLEKKKQSSQAEGSDTQVFAPPGMARMEQPLQQLGAQISSPQAEAARPTIAALANEMVHQIRVEAPPGRAAGGDYQVQYKSAGGSARSDQPARGRAGGPPGDAIEKGIATAGEKHRRVKSKSDEPGLSRGCD